MNKRILPVIDRTTLLNIKQDFTEEHDGKATNKLLGSAVRASSTFAVDTALIYIYIIKT